MSKTELLNHLASDPEDRVTLSRVCDRMEAAQRKNIPAHTQFLSPHEQQLTEKLIAASGYPSAAFCGGYSEAERCVCLFLPDWMDAENPEVDGLCALRITWNDGRELTHRDFLGALMGMGITRDKLGDILVGENSCDIILLNELSQYLLQSMESVGRSRVSVSMIELTELSVPKAQIKVIHDSVSTLRLDAVASSGFSASRGKMAEQISGGKVSLNWSECTKPDAQVREGDTISCRGLGKCRLVSVGGLSKKGRIMIEIERYI